ncbi:mechanosensitive ion channel family protein [Opitutaceae bacterium TAV4]|nr:mechanosensitive ion channel family protein [Opitutaceae bacterium TAV4]RRK01561.1 mechanosensitive ion channel family protein [Opitutaceae bacterium TAV3]
MQLFIDWLIGWLTGQGLSEVTATVVARGSMFLVVVILAVIVHMLVRATLVGLIKGLIHRSQVKWDDKLIESGVLAKLSHLAPLLVMGTLGRVSLTGLPQAGQWLEIFMKIYLLFIVLTVIKAFLRTVELIVAGTKRGAGLPMKGFSQAVMLIAYLIGGIILLSILLNKEPGLLLGGLTALTAVLMLVFKDAILGFVAGIQISVNQMVRIGDWIEMPKQGADGDVIDVSLTTVKVQNWDKTISTIPTYALISESFKNWRGMSESGGRRIKRSIYVDMQTVRFADEEMLANWRKLRVLKPYLDARLAEIAGENRELGEDLGVLGNGRRLTNVGTFRAYCAAYLRASPQINQNMTFLIRHLQPTAQGLPIELYVFTSDISWVGHENAQADVFDHLLAIMPQFGLRVFQSPSGCDLRDAVGALTGKS